MCSHVTIIIIIIIACISCGFNRYTMKQNIGRSMSLSEKVMVGDAAGNLELVDLNTLKTYIQEQATQTLDRTSYSGTALDQWISTRAEEVKDYVNSQNFARLNTAYELKSGDHNFGMAGNWTLS